MMKYTKPTYKNEALETEDIILTSLILDGGATLIDKGDGNAQVSTSVLDVLGLR